MLFVHVSEKVCKINKVNQVKNVSWSVPGATYAKIPFKPLAAQYQRCIAGSSIKESC